MNQTVQPGEIAKAVRARSAMPAQSDQKQTKSDSPAAHSHRQPDTNLLAALAYATGWLPGYGWILPLILLFLVRQRFARLQALQALVLFLLGHASLFVLTVLGWGRLWQLVYFLQLVLWLVLIYHAYFQRRLVLPWLTEWSEQQLESLPTVSGLVHAADKQTG